MQPTLRSYAETNVGRVRDHNEDSHLSDAELGLFIVADGMGGHAAGEVASAEAVKTVRAEMILHRSLIDSVRSGRRSVESARADLLSALEQAVHQACSNIFKMAEQDPEKRGMGTTLTVVLIIGQSAFIAHVGDSRCYLVRGDFAQQVTEDHTVYTQLIQKGKLSKEQIELLGSKKNALMRAVGVYETVDVDTISIELLPADILVLASDGLTQYLGSEGELANLAKPVDAAEATKRLIELANERGGSDNITVVYARVGDADAAGNSRAQRLAMKREVLAKVPIFARLSERELLRVMQIAAARELAAGETVIREQEAGDEFFVVLEGKVRVSRGDSTLAELGVGQTFGEMSLIRSAPRSATVSTLEPTVVLVIHRNDFFEILHQDAQAGVKVLWQFLGILSDRLNKTSDELRDVLEAPVLSDADVIADEA